MRYSFKKLISVLLGSTLLIFSACSCNSESDVDEPNTEAASAQSTTASATRKTEKISTDDTEEQPATYNQAKLKENSDNVMSIFDDYISDHSFKGVVYTKIGNDFEYISQEGQSVVEEHKSNSVNTQYYVGSLTKQFTAVAIMKLVEEDKLSVDDNINKYFEDYEYGEKITVKNLLTMTSGIPSYTCSDGGIDNNYYTNSQIENYNLTGDDEAHNKEAILGWILKQDLIFEPDSRFSFSDSNYYLLGNIIETVSGLSYEEYIEETIFKPLGMNSSTFDDADNLAAGYDGSDKYNWLYYDGVGYSSSGLITSVSDILKWVSAFDDYKIISEKSVDEMCTPYLENYAYGFFVCNDSIFQSARFGKYSSMLEFTRSESEIFISVSNYNYADPVHLFAMFKKFLNPYYG